MEHATVKSVGKKAEGKRFLGFAGPIINKCNANFRRLRHLSNDKADNVI